MLFKLLKSHFLVSLFHTTALIGLLFFLKSPSDNSQSSTSPGKLNSSRLSATHRHHHHHHHCHHHRQRQQNPEGMLQKEDKGPCGNRVVQVVIIILVLIMALWWVAAKLSLSLLHHFSFFPAIVILAFAWEWLHFIHLKRMLNTCTGSFYFYVSAIHLFIYS